MLKFLLVTLAVVSLLIFITNRGLHRSYLERASAEVVLSAYSNRFSINMFTEFATLPAYDRALIEMRCVPVLKSINLLRGTKSRLNPKREPECQALIRSGWTPLWTVADGLEFMRLNPRL